MADDSTDSRLARIEERGRYYDEQIAASAEARDEYIPRVKAIESGIGSLALAVSALDGSVKSLEATVNSRAEQLSQRLSIPEMQASAMWKERARVLKWIAGVLAAIIVAVAVYQINEYIVSLKTKPRKAAMAPATTAVTSTVTETAK